MYKVITTCYNCEAFIKKCIESLLCQKRSDWEMYIFDDASTDKSFEVATKVANGDSRIKIIKNKKNKGAVYNKTYNFVSHAKPKDEDVIVTLDGDDYLGSPYALCYLDKIYSKDYWLTYGGLVCLEEFFSSDLRKPIDWSKSLRNQMFCITHLRSHKFFLYKNVKDKDLRHRSGELFKIPEDIILNIPMAEMSGKDKCFFITPKLYYHRYHSNSDTIKNFDHRADVVKNDISFREAYHKKTKQQLLDWECDWSIV